MESELRTPSHMAVSSLPMITAGYPSETVHAFFYRGTGHGQTRAAARAPPHARRHTRPPDARPQAAPDRVAVTATVAYVIVTLPPIASMAAPVASSTTATWSGRSRVRVPWVGSRSSNASLV
jgi:hypothetical protein